MAQAVTLMALLLCNPELLSQQQHSKEEWANKTETDCGADQTLRPGVDPLYHEIGSGVAVGDRVVGTVCGQQHDVCPDEHGGHRQVLWQLPGDLCAGACCGGWQLLGNQPGALLVFLRTRGQDFSVQAFWTVAVPSKASQRRSFSTKAARSLTATRVLAVRQGRPDPLNLL